MFPCSFPLLKPKTKRRAKKFFRTCRAPELFTLNEFPVRTFSCKISEKSEFVLEFCAFFFCEKLLELQAKYSDKIHQAVKCLRKTSHDGSNFALKMPKLLQPFPKVSSCFFSRQKINEKRTKNKKEQSKSCVTFSGSKRCLFNRISGLKSPENVREFEETTNLYLPRTVEGISGSLKC